MDIAAEFLAALPEPHLILGVRLLPLSIGRYRLLKRLDSPFVDDEPREVPIEKLTGELFVALMVCGLPVEEFEMLLRHPRKLRREAKRFAKVARKIMRRTRDFSILTHIAQFKKYLAEGTSVPWHAIPRDGTGDESVSHWSYNVEIALRSRANWTDRGVNEKPLTQALADFYKLVESEGLVDLISHEAHEKLMSTGADNGRIFLELQQALERQRN